MFSTFQKVYQYFFHDCSPLKQFVTQVHSRLVLAHAHNEKDRTTFNVHDMEDDFALRYIRIAE